MVRRIRCSRLFPALQSDGPCRPAVASALQRLVPSGVLPAVLALSGGGAQPVASLTYAASYVLQAILWHIVLICCPSWHSGLCWLPLAAVSPCRTAQQTASAPCLLVPVRRGPVRYAARSTDIPDPCRGGAIHCTEGVWTDGVRCPALRVSMSVRWHAADPAGLTRALSRRFSARQCRSQPNYETCTFFASDIAGKKSKAMQQTRDSGHSSRRPKSLRHPRAGGKRLLAYTIASTREGIYVQLNPQRRWPSGGRPWSGPCV